MRIVHLLSVVVLSLTLLSSIEASDVQVYYLTNQLSNSAPEYFNFNHFQSKVDRNQDSNFNQNTQLNPQYVNGESSSSSNCEKYFAYDRDFSGIFGRVSVPAWNPQKSVVKAIFTVGSRIPPVSTYKIKSVSHCIGESPIVKIANFICKLNIMT